MDINSFLVKKLHLSHQQIKKDIETGFVVIDQQPAFHKQKITEPNTIRYKEETVQQGKALFYYAYNKPAGVESTLNTGIENNLIVSAQIDAYFFPVGRLDKASEGLMILTNDGKLYKEITDEKNDIEKCYEVVVDKEFDEAFLRQMEKGIVIMGTKTKPCKVSQMDKNKFKIVLIEGRNRQIRRMCYKLGYEVLSLKRTAIGKLQLGALKTGLKILVERSSIL